MAALSVILMALLLVQPGQAVEQSKEEKQNLEYMFNKVARKISDLLEINPNFLPFGAGMDVNGRVQFIWTDNKQKYSAKGAMILIRQAEIANANAGRLLAVATVYRYGHKDQQGNIKEQVNVEMEYADGYAIVRAIELIEKEGKKTIGKAVQRTIKPKIFTPAVVSKLLPKKK
ncbi:MAG: hypothetical protein CSA50_07205 [Gammaproteobacteria bacterium]|nr:MAG: hypothetical protein CSA50_07205 [Gammaproteobacteria bacterium]